MIDDNLKGLLIEKITTSIKPYLDVEGTSQIEAKSLWELMSISEKILWFMFKINPLKQIAQDYFKIYNKYQKIRYDYELFQPNYDVKMPNYLDASPKKVLVFDIKIRSNSSLDFCEFKINYNLKKEREL